MSSIRHHDRGRGLLGGLENDAVSRGQRWRHLPHGHQDREIPGNDLADDAERLVEMIGDGVVIDLADRAFLGADRAGEIAEMVDGQRNVGGHGLADRLAVVPGLGERKLLQIGFDPVGDLVEDLRAFGAAVRPQASFAAWAASSAASMSDASERAISQTGWPVIGEMLSKYLPALGARHSPPM